MNPDFWILWIHFLVPIFMLSVALADLSLVKKKQEEHDKKLDELGWQLARLKNQLESRFKLPDVDPSTLDKKYMTLDEMNYEAFRLWSLIVERDIPDKESILKELDDAIHKLERWQHANIGIGYIDPLSKNTVATSASWNEKRNYLEDASDPLSSTPD